MNDKFQHFIAWFAGTVILGMLFGMTAAFLVMVLLGFAKEVYDHFKGGCMDIWDLVADLGGILFGLLVLRGLL